MDSTSDSDLYGTASRLEACEWHTLPLVLLHRLFRAVTILFVALFVTM